MSAPVRKARSGERVVDWIFSANVARIASPPSWPCSSFIALKSSMLTRTTASGAPYRREASIWRSDSSWKARWLPRPGQHVAERVHPGQLVEVVEPDPRRLELLGRAEDLAGHPHDQGDEDGHGQGEQGDQAERERPAQDGGAQPDRPIGVVRDRDRRRSVGRTAGHDARAGVTGSRPVERGDRLAGRAGQGQDAAGGELGAGTGHDRGQGDVGPEDPDRRPVRRRAGDRRGDRDRRRAVGRGRRIADHDIARRAGGRGVQERVLAVPRRIRRDLAAGLAIGHVAIGRDHADVDDPVGRVGRDRVEDRPGPAGGSLGALGNAHHRVGRGRPGQIRFDRIKGRAQGVGRTRGGFLNPQVLGRRLAVEGGHQQGSADRDGQDRHRQQGQGQAQPYQPEGPGSNWLLGLDAAGRCLRLDRRLPAKRGDRRQLSHAEHEIRADLMVRGGPTACTGETRFRLNQAASY